MSARLNLLAEKNRLRLVRKQLKSEYSLDCDRCFSIDQEIEQCLDEDCEVKAKLVRNRCYKKWAGISAFSFAVTACNLEPDPTLFAVGGGIVITGFGMITLGSYWYHQFIEKKRQQKIQELEAQESAYQLRRRTNGLRLEHIDMEEEQLDRKVRCYVRALSRITNRNQTSSSLK